jgi:hypothetical protein
MGFWSSLGKGLGAGLGFGAGIALGNAAFGMDRIFAGGCFGDYSHYQAHQFSRMDAYMQGRFDQAVLDRYAMASALYYGRSAWG